MAEGEEKIVWKEAEGRFETEDGVAFLQYQVRPAGGGGAAALDLTHTFVPRTKRGKGVAALLCSAAFRHAKDRSLLIIPTCSYVSDTFLPRNPSWKAIVYGASDEPKSSM